MKLEQKLFIAGLSLAISFGIAAQSFADDMTNGTTRDQSMDPNFKATVNQSVVDTDMSFSDRLRADIKNRPAPQIGQTRGAIEAIYGPAETALAPNKDYQIYTNEYEIIDGKMFHRTLTHKDLKIYEVTYNTTSGVKSGDDKITDVRERVIPRVGDHKNLVGKMLGYPMNVVSDDHGNHIVYGIPKERYGFYNSTISTPFEAVNMYFNSDGFLVGQEFMPAFGQGQHVLTSAGRYIEYQSNNQPDQKVGY